MYGVKAGGTVVRQPAKSLVNPIEFRFGAILDPENPAYLL